MSRPTEKERAAMADLYHRLARELNEWRKQWDINSFDDPMFVFGGGLGTVIHWWLEAHFPNRNDALGQLDVFAKAWRMVLSGAEKWGKRL